MLLGWQGMAGVALVALLVGVAGGWRLGTAQGAAERASLDRQLQDARGLADARRTEIAGARTRVGELEREATSRVDSPAVVYVTREVERELEGPPALPAGYCASERFGRLLDTLSAGAGADDPRRARAGARPSAGAPRAAPAPVPDGPPAGYIPAVAFRRWALAAEQQYRAALTRDADWYRFARTLPCVEFPQPPTP